MIYLLKAFKGDKEVLKIKTKNYNRFKSKLSLAQKIKSDIGSYYLKIQYAKGYINEGYYHSKKDLRQAYRAFVNPWLINYVEGGD